MQPIYLDHSATTPLDPRVLDAMMPFFGDHFGNSLAVHSHGRTAERGIEESRATVARLLNCQASEIVFTSGGTESDNLALRGLALSARLQDRPFTLITSAIEHHAVTVTARQLVATLGASVRIVGVDRHGLVAPDDLRAALRGLPADGIALVSLIHTHNEVGSINPLAELAAIARDFGALVHTDAVQASGHGRLDVQALNVDLLSISSHKFYGPKGAGVLFLREGVELVSAQTGARHEDGRRAGTHNTPGIVGTARALELVDQESDASVPRLTLLRDRLIAGITAAVPDCKLTGHPTQRHPGLASFAFKDLDSNVLLMHLDQRGISASSGSACQVGNSRPSAILEALGLDPAWTRGGLRLSLGRANTEDDVETVLTVLPEAVRRTRKLAAPTL